MLIFDNNMSEHIQADTYDAGKVKNMGFSQVAETFVKAGWIISVNTQSEICFNHPSDPNLAYELCMEEKHCLLLVDRIQKRFLQDV